MHEWSLAESVACTIKNEMEKHHFAKLSSVVLRIGELQMIDIDIFLFALQEYLITYALPIGINNIKTKMERCLFRCRLCMHEWDLEEAKLQEIEEESIHFLPEVAHIFMRCPGCGSVDFEFVKGRGIWLESLEGEAQ